MRRSGLVLAGTLTTTGPSTSYTHPNAPSPAPVPPLPAAYHSVVLRVTGEFRFGRGIDRKLETHVKSGSGGLVELDKLPPERSRTLALSTPAVSALNQLEAVTGLKYTFNGAVGGQLGSTVGAQGGR